jgi:hypothetical protein
MRRFLTVLLLNLLAAMTSRAAVRQSTTIDDGSCHLRRGAKSLSWKSGYFVVLDFESHVDSGLDHVRVYDNQGRLLLGTRLELTEADRTRVYDAAMSGNGPELVVSGLSWSRSGQMATFLAWIDAKGSVRRIVRTNPFLIRAMTIAADGSIWGLGLNAERIAESRELIQRYSKDGILIGKYLTDSWNTGGRHPASTSHIGPPAIVSSNQSVGVFLPESRQWLEFGLDGVLLNRWSINCLEPGGGHAEEWGVPRLAMTPSGTVYAWVQASGNSGLYQLDRKKSCWSRSALEGGSGYRSLDGVDGEAPILLDQDTNGALRYKWLDLNK